MTPLRAFAIACAAAVLSAPLLSAPAAAQPAPATPSSDQGKPRRAALLAHRKNQRLCGLHQSPSARAYDSRKRYFSWVSKNGPTGKERIIYGLYTIYDTSDCRKDVEKANALEPRDAELEAAAVRLCGRRVARSSRCSRRRTTTTTRRTTRTTRWRRGARCIRA